MNRSSKYTEKTQASILFPNGTILVERKEGMPIDFYKQARTLQKKVMKAIFRGKPDRNISRLMENRLGYNKH